jgi:hypothetical protein
MKLGHALVIKAQVAIFFAADQREIALDLNRRPAIDRNQLCAHRQPARQDRPLAL